MSKLAVITGGSSGIGQSYAERLARDGWNLVVIARRRARLEELAEQLTAEHGITVRALAADLSQQDQLEALCDDIAGLGVDMLINNAALAHYMPFDELPPDQAEELVRLNVLAPVLLTRAVVPDMRRRSRGSIINIASLLAFSGAFDGPHLPARAVYAASKSFLVTFTQLLAHETRKSGIRVMVVCPGVVRSEFHTRQGMDLSAVPRMESDAVVEASLIDLERGEVLSIPPLSDDTARERLKAAQLEMMEVTRTVELPGRYRQLP